MVRYNVKYKSPDFKWDFGSTTQYIGPENVDKDLFSFCITVTQERC